MFLPALLVALASGCADEAVPTAPDQEQDEVRDGSLDMPALQEAAGSSPLRIKVGLEPRDGGWLARELEVYPRSDVSRPERMEAEVVAVSPDLATLTLRLGDRQVRVASDASFFREWGEPLSREELHAELSWRLSSGPVGVELRRAPIFPPQDPGDPAFEVEEIRLDPGSDDQVLEFNIDARHVVAHSGSTGTLSLVGLQVGVNLQGGSDLQARSEAEAGAVEVVGSVASVDEGAGSLTLEDGRTVRLVEGTEVKNADKAGHFGSLAEVAAALDDGESVKVESEAVLESGDVYVAVEIELEADDDGEFGGRVESVDEDAQTFTLKNGRVYVVTGDTEWDEEGDLTTLEAMTGALAAGDVVTVEGMAEEDGESGEWIVLSLTVETSGEDGEFGGRVESVDEDAQTFTLKSGRVYTVTGDTEWDEEGDLTTLEAMVGAMDAGDVVTVGGMAEKDGESGEWIVLSLTVETSGEDGEFAGRVASVDLDAETFTLTNGRTYTVTEDTEWDEEGALLTLEAMAGALDAGDIVMVQGVAEKDGETGEWIALSLKAETNGNGETGQFGGRVATVDLDAQTFTLKNGRVYTVTGDTEWDEEGDLTTLEAMAGAMDAGDVVTVDGQAEKDGETGEWIVLAIRVGASGDDGEFGGRVDSVDLDAGSFTLKSGRVYTVTGDTEWDEEGALVTLEAMAGAMDAGDAVTVEGTAEKDSETGEWLVVSLTVATSGEDGEFGGQVESVDLDARTFTLKSGRAYTVTGDTEWSADSDPATLEEIAETLDDGGKVIVEGAAEKDAETGAWVVVSLSAKVPGPAGSV